MFSYYGSKSKIVQYYPKPRYNKIIEPFCGSARYSLRYFENDILLIDKYDVIVNTWKWLQQCSTKDVLSLPVMKIGENLDNYNLTDNEKIFMGFIVQQGTTGLRKTVSSFAEKNIKVQLKNVAEQLFKIKHWTIKLGSYEQIENEQATWFIDPPYQFGGHGYKYSNKHIDYTQLAKWCKSRNGQAIVCENTKSNWLLFKPMTEMYGTMFKTTEAIWSNLETAYDHEQMSLAI